ncbi:HAD family hydrolase [Janibacter sp. GXQ6167]|uniref:HAD family hydrolase n=1 Tax=Janibacter sp. GXQ6167 TaxID=3240791 RepID=UPI00352673CB
MSEPRWPTVVFDFDGTLADTISIIMDAFRHTTATVLGWVEDDDVIRAGIGRTLAARMHEIDADRADELEAVYVPFMATELPRRVTAYLGMSELVADLRAAGVRVAVATSRRRAQTAEALATLGLDGDIEVLVALEDTEIHKPQPDPLLLACERLGVDPASAVYVGDAVVDVQAAQAAQMSAVAVTWGAGRDDDLAAAEPTRLVHDHQTLREVLLP